jgi:hypothetical protein
MKLDVNNFENYTIEEYINNLSRLNIINHISLVGEVVYYSRKIYGEHKVIKWDPNKAEFLLDLEGQQFWSNPFKIIIIK